MTTGQLKIHSENILPIIKKWLYSDRDIFTRELISNATDAIRKLKILRDQGKASCQDSEFRIDIIPDKEKGTLTISDTGVGMDAEEVEKYIAQIAFSGAEDFIKQYEGSTEKDQFIGHFGLGFYSSYMVADLVEIQTKSYKEGAQPAHWSCDGSDQYTLEEGTRESRGTDIILHLSEENKEYLDTAHLKKILSQYCEFLPFPIYLGEERLNEKEPLWIKSPRDLKDEDYLDFYRQLYPFEGDPLFWIHLNIDYPFHLQGILYFPKMQKNVDLSKTSIKLFCNRVFVSDNCKEILPEFLLPLRGVIDSPDIPLNVSRSTLQMDRTVRRLSTHITKKVGESIHQLYTQEKEKFLNCWDDLSLVVKIGAIQNEKFYEKVKPCLIFQQVDGDPMNAEDYLLINKEKTNDKIFYTSDPTHNSPLIEMYKDKGIDVLIADHPVDSHLLSFLESKITPATFKRVDTDIDDHLAEGESSNEEMAKKFSTLLDKEGVKVEAKKLSANHLPGLISMDENQRRLRDYMRSIDPSHQTNMMDERTLVINTENPLINAIISLDNQELAKELSHEVLDLALLSQREMDATSFNAFLKRTNLLLEKLLQNQS